jgi:type II secretory pathway pseudopilin PulG
MEMGSFWRFAYASCYTRFMKVGGYRKASSGFTIVETTIVIAVSGGLFLAAVVLISGRTNKTQFVTAANDLKQSLQQVINETATGYFPNSNNVQCTPGVSAMPTLVNGSQQQGTNGGCIFLGKAVQFGATDYDTGFLTYAITGNRLQTGTQTEVTTLAQAFPEAVAPGSTVVTNLGLTGVTTRTPLQNGLTAEKVTYSGGETGGFAFLSTLANYSAAGSPCNGVCSGSQGLTLYAIASTAVGLHDSPGFVDVLDGGSAKYVPVTQITACFNSGTTNQSAVYTIGESGNSQSVTLRMQSGAC